MCRDLTGIILGGYVFVCRSVTYEKKNNHPTSNMSVSSKCGSDQVGGSFNLQSSLFKSLLKSKKVKKNQKKSKKVKTCQKVDFKCHMFVFWPGCMIQHYQNFSESNLKYFLINCRNPTNWSYIIYFKQTTILTSQ